MLVFALHFATRAEFLFLGLIRPLQPELLCLVLRLLRLPLCVLLIQVAQ